MDEPALESPLLSPLEQRRISSTVRLQMAFTALVVTILAALLVLVFVLVRHIFGQMTPAVRTDLEWKAQRGATELARSADIGIALRDIALIDKVLGPYREDLDILSVVVIDTNGETIRVHGRSPDAVANLFSGPPHTIRRENEYIVSWSPSEIEGGIIGNVSVAVSTARIHAGAVLQRQILVLFGLGSLIALAVTYAFVRLYVGPVLSITRQAFKRLEETTQAALAAARLKSEFIANVSHEIRTPMNGIRGTVELLQRTTLSPRQAKHINTLHSSSCALMAVLDDVLDFAKIEAGKLEIRAKVFDLRRLVSSVVELFQARAELKGLQLIHCIADNVPGHVRLDEDRLRQILSNLVGNAVKFTDCGTVEVHIGVLSHDANRCVLRFEVRDTGIGIPAEAISQLFVAFSQVDGSAARKQGGTGLGLAICHKLTDLLGGTIGVESTLGQGSCFWLHLPIEVAQGEPSVTALPAAESVPLADFSKQAIRVLVADDNPINRDILSEMLAALGCQCDCVTNGSEAIRSAGESRYSIILMDCQMPGIDGYEATRQIRARELGTRRIPIVAATAHAFESERERTKAAGMDDLLTKPISMAALAATLERWAGSGSATVVPTVESVRAPEEVSPLEPMALPDPILDPEIRRTPKGVRSFRTHVPEQVERIRRAIDSLDTTELCQAAHRLKGSCTMIGATRMASLCLALERSNGDAKVAFARLEDEYSSVLAQLPQG